MHVNHVIKVHVLPDTRIRWLAEIHSKFGKVRPASLLYMCYPKARSRAFTQGCVFFLNRNLAFVLLSYLNKVSVSLCPSMSVCRKIVLSYDKYACSLCWLKWISRFSSRTLLSLLHKSIICLAEEHSCPYLIHYECNQIRNIKEILLIIVYPVVNLHFKKNLHLLYVCIYWK